MIILVVVKEIVLANDSSFKFEVSRLLAFGVDESGDVLDIEPRLTLVHGLITEGITIIRVDYL